MYEKHFGLRQKPFRSLPRGAEVYTGPEASRLAKTASKALAYGDAIFLITGAAGVGKTTLAHWVLQERAEQASLICVPRARLGHDEVLDFLLDQLGASAVPAGMLRKDTLCKQLLAEKSHPKGPVCVLVEDAARIGEDGLIELESLTAADGDEFTGAQLVLLGNPNLELELKAAPLARILQRVRGRFQQKPLGASELTAYLEHGFSLTDKAFDDLFTDGSAELLFMLTAGTPRMLNAVVESALAAAASANFRQVDLPLIRRVAEEEHCLEAPSIPQPSPQPRPAAPAEVGRSDARKESAALYATLPDLDKLAPGLTSGLAPNETRPIAKPRPVAPVIEPETRRIKPAESDDSQLDSDPIPTLFSSTRMEAPVAEKPAAASKSQEIIEQNDPPAWERDPTLAELRPDLEALELAMAQFADEEPAKPNQSAESDPVVELKDPTFMGVPEITLDVAIREKIAEATEALQKHDATIAEDDVAGAPAPLPKPKPAAAKASPEPPAITPEKAKPKPAAAPVKAKGEPAATAPAKANPQPRPQPAPQAEQARPAPPRSNPSKAPVTPKAAAPSDYNELAAGIANAKTLEDMDDRMAETLFGEEFSAIAAQVAAQVAANPPPAEADNDDDGSLELELVEDDEVANDNDADGNESQYEREFKAVYGEHALEVNLQGDAPQGGLDLSASQRLATVRALNANRNSLRQSAANQARPGNGRSPEFAKPAATPQPIEEQISTSMTQTLRALSARPKPANDDDDDAPRGGFFSRFKRS
jgi:type II secretory pathway predicted ATPase ExeA